MQGKLRRPANPKPQAPSPLQEFLELFDYNAWANRTIFDAVAQLPEEQYFRDLKSSYGGISGTLGEIVWAPQLWVHPRLGRPKPVGAPGEGFKSGAGGGRRGEGGEGKRGGVGGGGAWTRG